MIDENIEIKEDELQSETTEENQHEQPDVELEEEAEPSKDSTLSEESDKPESDDNKETSFEDLPLPDGEDIDEKDHEKNWPKGFKERLERQKRQLQKAEEEKLLLAQEHQRLLEEQGNKKQAAITGQEPKREHYSTEEEWLDAALNYREQTKLIEQRRAQEDQVRSKFYEELHRKSDRAIDKGVAKYTDYEDVIAPILSKGFPTNLAMAEAIFDSPQAHNMLYFLGKHVEEAKKIALLPPVQAVKKIAELEARYIAHTKSNVTKATKPVTTTSGKSADVSIKGDPSKMDANTYRKWREQSRKRS